MILDLIEQAKAILKKSSPADDELLQVENGLSTYLEALATHRISDQVDLEDLDEANRLLREIRRERGRRAASPSQTVQQEKPPAAPTIPTTARPLPPTPAVNRLDLQNDGGIDPLRKFFQSSHDPEAERLMDEAEELFTRVTTRLPFRSTKKLFRWNLVGRALKSTTPKRKNSCAQAISHLWRCPRSR